MSYKRTYSNRSNTNSSSKTASGDETVIQLDNKKQVTIRKFNNINLVDIREFYTDKDGEKKPGKKGISLTEDTWYKLLENTNKIQNALDVLNGQTPKSTTAPVKQDKKERKPKTVNSEEEEEFVDVEISKKRKISNQDEDVSEADD